MDTLPHVTLRNPPSGPRRSPGLRQAPSRLCAGALLPSQRLPDGLRATPLVEPIVEHTIGLVTPVERFLRLFPLPAAPADG